MPKHPMDHHPDFKTRLLAAGLVKMRRLSMLQRLALNVGGKDLDEFYGVSRHAARRIMNLGWSVSAKGQKRWKSTLADVERVIEREREPDGLTPLRKDYTF